MLASVTLATFQGFTPASSPRDHASVYINQACLPVTFVSSLISLANTVSSLPSTSRSFARHRVLRSARATHHASAPCIFTILLAPCLDPHVRPCACRLSGSARNHRWVALAHDACVSVRHVLVQSQSYPRRTQLAPTTATTMTSVPILYDAGLSGAVVPATKSDSVKIPFTSASARRAKKLNATLALNPLSKNSIFNSM